MVGEPVRFERGSVPPGHGDSFRSAGISLAPPGAGVELAHGHTSRAEREAQYARWIILLRWVAVVVAAVLVFFTVPVLHLLPQAQLPALGAGIGVLAASNAVYWWLVRRGRAAGLLAVQCYSDLVLLTVLLHFSGGIENPLGILMLFHVIIAGIVLPRRQCYTVAAVGSALFALLAGAEWSGIVGHYTLTLFPHYEMHGQHLHHAAHDAGFVLSRGALQAAILFLTAYFTTTVTEQLRRDERQIAAFADHVLAQSQLLQRALEGTDTGLCVCDRELRPTWRNGRWASWFEGPSAPGGADAGGDPVAPAVAVEALRRTLGDGRVRASELTLSPAEPGRGEPRAFLLTTAPLLDKDGSTTHVVQLAREVTEQKRTQERALRAEKLAALGELAGKVAHEVNNPIGVISAKARLLLTDHRAELSNRTAEELRKMTELADRVARIAQGLLGYCRPAPRAAGPLDIRVPVRRALAMVEPLAASAGVRVEERLGGMLPAVRANAGEMEQVFLNLFVNALDAMPRGGRLTVTAEAEPAAADRAGSPAAAASPGEGGALRVTVADTGHGILPEVRDRVFEPFVTTKPEGRGTGLGLAITLGLVRAHGGSIQLESEPGQGTRVVVRLPLAAGVDSRPEHAAHA